MRNHFTKAVTWVLTLLLTASLFALPVSADKTAIAKVTLGGYVLPVRGQKAEATVTVADAPCRVTEAGWFDVTANKAVAATAAFQAEHEYYLFVKLLPEETAEFTDKTKVTITDQYGKAVECRLQVKVEGINESVVVTKAVTPAAVIASATVTGFVEPIDGAKPVTSMGIPAQSPFSVAKAVWYDITAGAELKSSSTFTVDHEYRFTVQLAPVEGYVFSTATTLAVKDKSGRVIASGRAKFVEGTNRVTISTLEVRPELKRTTESRINETTTTTAWPQQSVPTEQTTVTTKETIRTIATEPTQPSIKRRLANLWWVWLIVILIVAVAGGAITLFALNDRYARQQHKRR